MADRVWSDKQLVRRASRRLAVLRHAEEVSGNVSATCRYYGISRNIFYRWRRRYEDEGLEGLKDRSSAPLHCPTIVSGHRCVPSNQSDYGSLDVTPVRLDKYVEHRPYNDSHDSKYGDLDCAE